MSAQTHAVLDADGVVTNLILIDDPAGWTPPEGHTVQVVRDEATAIGYRWDGDHFTAPVAGVAPLSPEAAIAAMQEQVDALTVLLLEGEA